MMSLKDSVTAPLWLAYKNYIKLTLLGNTEADLQDISYWRSVIFVNIITYIIPLSIFTLIPSIYMAFRNDIVMVGFADIIVFLLLIVLAIAPGLTLANRKFIFMMIAYSLAVILLFFQSWSGPGLLFLLAATIFASIIYTASIAYYSALANTIICIIFWLLLYTGFDMPLTTKYDPATWIAISSNLIFLSFVCAKFLRQLIDGMELSFNDGKKMQANLTAIINSTDSNIYSLDRNFRYISFNKVLKDAMKQLHGLDIQPGDAVFNFLETKDSEEAKFWFDKYTEAFTGTALRFEKDYNIGGEIFTTYFSINPIVENDEIIGLSCFGIDITDQKKIRLERDDITNDLIARNKNLEQFSFIVSHNLRAPTANIIGFANLLKYETLNPAEVIEIVDGISTAASKLDSVIKDLNEILQIRAATIENKQYVYFQELVSDISLSIDTILYKQNVTIKTDFQHVEKMASLKSYLYSIFDNLIKNSVKFHFPGRPLIIEITSQETTDGIRLIFRDNGLGIDLSKNQGKVFGLYGRFHSHIEGKGMGLFMVKTQVDTLGGKIQVQSEVNVGTEFTIDFLV